MCASLMVVADVCIFNGCCCVLLMCASLMVVVLLMCASLMVVAVCVYRMLTVSVNGTTAFRPV